MCSCIQYTCTCLYRDSRSRISVTKSEIISGMVLLHSFFIGRLDFFFLIVPPQWNFSMTPYTMFLFTYVYLCFIHKKNIFSPPPKNSFSPHWSHIPRDKSECSIPVRGRGDHKFSVGCRMALQRANGFSHTCFFFSVLWSFWKGSGNMVTIYRIPQLWTALFLPLKILSSRSVQAHGNLKGIRDNHHIREILVCI